MGFILAILRILGLLLLGILILLLAVLLTVLFIPVRYRARLLVPETGKADGLLRLSWFLHAVSITGTLEQGHTRLRLRILGLILFDSARPPKKSGAGDKPPDAIEKKADAETDRTGEPDKEKPAQKPDTAKEQQEPSEAAGHSVQDSGDSQPSAGTHDGGKAAGTSADAEAPASKERQDKRIFRRITEACRNFTDRIKRILENLKNTFRAVCDKIKQMRHNMEYYVNLFQNRETQEVLRRLWKQTKLLLGHIRPRDVKGYIAVGTGDPASTANIMAVDGLLYPWIGNTLRIEPQFDRVCLYGDLQLHGRLTLVVFATIAAKLFFDKKLRRLIKRVKNGPR